MMCGNKSGPRYISRRTDGTVPLNRPNCEFCMEGRLCLMILSHVRPHINGQRLSKTLPRQMPKRACLPRGE